MSKHVKKQKLDVQVQGNNIRVKITNSILKFSPIYKTNKIKIQISWVLFLGLLSAVFGVFLIQNTGLYHTGLNAIAAGFARFFYYLVFEQTKNQTRSFIIFNFLFWGLYLLLNVPLIVFSALKIGKKFTILSSIYILTATLGALAISFIPNVNKIFLFGDLRINNPNFTDRHVVQLVLWNYDLDAQKHLTIFLYGVLWGLLQGVILAGLLITDCSSGDFDFLAIWYSESRYKDISFLLFITNVIVLVIGYIIGTFIPGSLALQQINANPIDRSDITLNSQAWSPGIFFSPNLLSSFLMSLITIFLLDLLFPKFRMMRAEIYSSKAEEIADALIADNRPYSLSIHEVKGGYSKKTQQILVTNCMFLETADLLDVVRRYDPNALFVLSGIKKVDGYINLTRKQPEDKKNPVIFFKKKKQNPHDTNNLINSNQTDKLITGWSITEKNDSQK